jgi:hypothetical protein
VRRRIFNFVSGLSLLVGIAAAVFWVRSYSRLELAMYGRQAGDYHTLVGISISNGKLAVSGTGWKILGQCGQLIGHGWHGFHGWFVLLNLQLTCCE